MPVRHSWDSLATIFPAFLVATADSCKVCPRFRAPNTHLMSSARRRGCQGVETKVYRQCGSGTLEAYAECWQRMSSFPDQLSQGRCSIHQPSDRCTYPLGGHGHCLPRRFPGRFGRAAQRHPSKHARWQLSGQLYRHQSPSTAHATDRWTRWNTRPKPRRDRNHGQSRQPTRIWPRRGRREAGMAQDGSRECRW